MQRELLSEKDKYLLCVVSGGRLQKSSDSCIFFISSHTAFSGYIERFTGGEKECASVSRIEDTLHIASVYQIPTASFLH